MKQYLVSSLVVRRSITFVSFLLCCILCADLLLTGCKVTETQSTLQDSVVTPAAKTTPPSLDLSIDAKYYVSMAISADGSLLALGDGVGKVIRCWNTRSGNLVSTIPIAPLSWPSVLQISNDNQKIIVTDILSPLYTLVFDITTANKICSIWSERCFFTDNSGTIIGNGFDTISNKTKIRVYSATDGSIISDITPEGVHLGMSIIGLSSGGQQYLYLPNNNDTIISTINQWNVQSNSLAQSLTFSVHPHGVNYSNDGSLVAEITDDTSLVLYNMSTKGVVSTVHSAGFGEVLLDDYRQLSRTSISKNLTANVTFGSNFEESITLFNNSNASIRSVLMAQPDSNNNKHAYTAIVMSRDESTLAAWCGNTDTKLRIWYLK